MQNNNLVVKWYFEDSNNLIVAHPFRRLKVIIPNGVIHLHLSQLEFKMEISLVY